MADAPKQQPQKETELERLARCVKERKVCSGTFKVGPGGHYRLGKLYQAGELITIADEIPGKEWRPFDPNYKEPLVLPPPAPKGSALAPGDIAI